MTVRQTLRKPSNEPIAGVQPLRDGVLQVRFFTGNSATVDLSPRFHTARFCPLRRQEVWESAVSHGDFIHWYRDGIAVVELAYDELLTMVAGERYL